MEPNPVEVKALENFNIYIKFENGEEKVYNAKNLVDNFSFYRNLKNNYPPV